MSIDDRNLLTDVISDALQFSARSRSKDGMTGMNELRRHGLASDVLMILLQDHRDLVARVLHHTHDPDLAARRANADLADDGTPKGRVWARLLHLMLDFEQAGDEDAEEYFGDLLDVLHKRGMVSP